MGRPKLLVAATMLALGVSSRARGQAEPAAIAPYTAPGRVLASVPSVDGSFQYALHASELLQTGYAGASGVTESTSLSGDVAYYSKSTVRPFSLLYAGGVLLGNQAGETNAPFQSLSLTQGLVTRGWVFNVADAVSYLPQSPTTGLSGIPGTGDLGSTPINTGLEPTQSVLSNTNVNRLSNTVTGQVQRRLTGLTSISGTGSYGIVRYENDFGLDSNQYNGVVSLNHTLDGRDSVFVNASYGVFSYPAGGAFNTKSLNFGFQRLVSRKLTATVSGGPFWVNSSSNLGIPSNFSVGVDASMTYAHRFANLTARFDRGVNGGSGVQPGAISNSFFALASKPFGRHWSTGVNASVNFNQGLSQNPTAAATTLGSQTPLLFGNTTSIYAGAQVSRSLGPNFSTYLTYTAIQQSTSAAAYANQTVLNGLSNTFSIGVSFSPRSTHLGQL